MRVGIVGAGGQARAHASAYRALDVDIAGVVGRTPGRAERLGRDLDIRWWTDIQPLLDDATVDAVSVCTPNHTHRDLVCAALRAGKHVLCEAGPGETLDDIDAMEAAEGDRILAVFPGGRITDESAEIIATAKRGDLGRALAATHVRLVPGTGATAGSMLRFDADDLCAVFGLPDHVRASAVGDRHLFVTLEAQDAIATIEIGVGLPNSYPVTAHLNVVFEAGVLDFQISFPRDVWPPPSTFTRYTADGATSLPLMQRGPDEAVCDHFVRSIRGEADADVLAIAHARAPLRVALAAERSIASGIAEAP